MRNTKLQEKLPEEKKEASLEIPVSQISANIVMEENNFEEMKEIPNLDLELLEEEAKGGNDD